MEYGVIKLLKKKVSVKYKNTGGRSSITGRITVRGRQGVNQRKRYLLSHGVRVLDKVSSTGYVLSILGKRLTQGWLGSVYYELGFVGIILLEDSMKIGSKYNHCMFEKELKLGDVNYLKNFNLGNYIFNIERQEGLGGVLAKTAGTFAVLYGYNSTEEKVVLKMPSGWLIMVSAYVLGTLGIVSNKVSKRIPLNKAGKKRLLGKRPKVRGVAMNPVDHPHGGGEGKKTPKLAKTPWGKLTKGYSTKKKRYQLIIKKKRKLK